MSNVCQELRSSEADHQVHEFWKQLRAENGLAEKYTSSEIENSPWHGKVLQSLIDKYGDGTTVTQANLDKALKRFVKNKDERTRAKLLMNLNSILKNNELLREHLWKDITYETLERSSLMKLKNWDPDNDNAVINIKGNEYIVPKLERLPLPMLNWIYNYAYGWHTAGSDKLNIAPGILGTLQLEILTPRSMEKRDVTGAIRRARLSTEGYADRAQSFQQKFWERNPETGKRGFRQILHDISDLAGPRTNIDKNTLHYMFHWFPDNRISIDKNGQVYHKKNKVFTGEYHEDGNPVLEWDEAEILLNERGEPVMLDKETMKGEDLSPYDTFIAAVRDGQDLFEEVAEEVARVVEDQSNAYRKLQSRINPKEGKSPIPEEILKSISPFYYESEDGQHGKELDIDGFNRVGKKPRSQDGLRGYSPIIYLDAMIPNMIDSAIREMSNKRAELEADLKAGIKDGTYNKEKQDLIRDKITKLDETLRPLSKVSDDIDGVSQDPNTGQLLLGRQTVKNFKNISGIFDPRLQRSDRLVIDDYLDNIGKTLERNNVTIEILNAMADSDHAGIQDYIHELYKTTFNYPDVKSSFLGIPTDMPTFTKMLNRVPGMNVPIDMAQRMLKGIGSWQIFNLLSNMMSGVRNWTATVNKIHDVGIDRVIDAMSELDGQNGDVWKARAERAGVVNFARYIEGWVNKRLRPEERLAAKEAMRFYKDYLNDIKKAKNFTGKEKLYRKFKARLQSLKLQEAEQLMDVAAQWAVTHNTSDLELLEIQKMEGKKKYVSTQPGYKKAFKVLLAATKQFKSIQETEGYIRTLSFIIGTKAAVDSGVAPSLDSKEAVEYGVEYTYRSDHGLSQQHLGLAYRGALGNLNTKLKYWSTQRFGREFRLIRDAWRNVGDYSLDESNPNSINENQVTGKPSRGQVVSKSVKMFDALLNPLGWGKQQALREVNPQLAAFRSFMGIQGVATFVVDYMLFMPGGSFVRTGLKKMFFRNQSLKAGTGLTSDLLSLMYGSMHLLSNGILAHKESEDEESMTDFMKRMLRHTHTGVLPTSIASYLFSLAASDEDEKQRHKRDAITPMLPLGSTGAGLLEDFKIIDKPKR